MKAKFSTFFTFMTLMILFACSETADTGPDTALSNTRSMLDDPIDDPGDNDGGGQLATPTLIAPAIGGLANNTSVNFSWTAVPGFTVKYNLYVGLNENLGINPMRFNNITSTSYTVNGLQRLEKYYWRVEAMVTNDATFSELGHFIVNVATPTASGFVTNGGVPNLSWNSVPGATHYKVKRISSVAGVASQNFTTTSTQFSDPLPFNVQASTGSLFNSVSYAVSAVATATDGTMVESPLSQYKVFVKVGDGGGF